MTPDTPKPMRQRMAEYIIDLQDRIVKNLEALDPAAPKFKRDSWLRPQGGEGTSCVFYSPPTFSDFPSGLTSTDTTQQSESVLEKAGVNTSMVHGVLPPAAIRQMVADHSTIPFDPAHPRSLPFFAAGISLVIHPRNPYAPTVHANYRYFELLAPDESSSSKLESVSAPPREGGSSDQSSHASASGVQEGPASTTRTGIGVHSEGMTPIAWWFGGGSDLTPSYLYDEDATHFHSTLRDACARFSSPHSGTLYKAFKAWCDEYFYIPHRGERRGIGGIFFDDLTSAPHKRLPEGAARPRSAEEIFSFVRACGDAFLPSYLPILQRRMHVPYDAQMRRWQLLRRGRYVEFNLVYDRGTKFGLMTPGARVESILMSLPETARWEYMSEAGQDEGSEEYRLLQVLRNPRDWV